eukprot:gnl/Trimastix_PCT/2116.p1 GENE.gnl/Trimastix_PCT/2116~~gnl/Trimastix_PCT/2116.p1  ORF type:complete len:241 (+),score=60.95 gnl/Trimastix_PCT/2116:154-876(+)
MSSELAHQNRYSTATLMGNWFEERCAPPKNDEPPKPRLADSEFPIVRFKRFPNRTTDGTLPTQDVSDRFTTTYSSTHTFAQHDTNPQPTTKTTTHSTMGTVGSAPVPATLPAHPPKHSKRRLKSTNQAVYKGAPAEAYSECVLRGTDSSNVSMPLPVVTTTPNFRRVESTKGDYTEERAADLTGIFGEPSLTRTSATAATATMERTTVDGVVMDHRRCPGLTATLDEQTKFAGVQLWKIE